MGTTCTRRPQSKMANLTLLNSLGFSNMVLRILMTNKLRHQTHPVIFAQFTIYSKLSSRNTLIICASKPRISFYYYYHLFMYLLTPIQILAFYFCASSPIFFIIMYCVSYYLCSQLEHIVF